MMLKQKPALFICMLFAGVLGMAWQAAAAQQAEVASAVFTTAIDNRSPVDQVLLLTNNVDKVFFHTDLHYFENQKIIHRWEYNGDVVLSRTFEVKGPRWPVYSTKNLSPDQLGTWRVVVTNEEGWPLRATIFKYVDSKTGGNAILPFTE